MGLAVFDGQVYPVWAGNFNQSTDPAGTVIADPLNIWYRPMVIAAGPRIINSTMGPIPLSEAASTVTSRPQHLAGSSFYRAPSTRADQYQLHSGSGNVRGRYYHDTISRQRSLRLGLQRDTPS